VKGCVFITPEDSAYGFSLTGIRQVISSRENILDDLTQIVAADSAGLVFIDERLLSDTIRGMIEVTEKRWPGAIVIIPEPSPATEGPGAGDYGMQLVSRVLGYQMKLS